MKVLIQLIYISYKGDVGRNWSFKITSGKSVYPFNAEIKNGENRKLKKNVYLEQVNGSRSVSLPVTIVATERDKAFSESGTNSRNVRINLTDPQPQTFAMSVTVKEDRGPKVKTMASGKLDFGFVAYVTDVDSSCDNLDEIDIEVLVTRNFPISGFPAVEKRVNKRLLGYTEIDNKIELTGCLYERDGYWLIRPVKAIVKIRWNVYKKWFREAYIPKGHRKEDCEKAQDIRLDLQDEIKKRRAQLGTTPPPGTSKVSAYDAVFVDGYYKGYYVEAAIDAHEMVHIERFKDIIRTSWNTDFREQISGRILGNSDEMTRAEANKEMLKYLKDITDPLYESFRKDDYEDVADVPAIAILQKMVDALFDYNKQNCGKKK